MKNTIEELVSSWIYIFSWKIRNDLIQAGFFPFFFILLMVFLAQAMFEYFTQKKAKNDGQTMDWNSKKRSRSKNGSLMNRNQIRSILCVCTTFHSIAIAWFIWNRLLASCWLNQIFIDKISLTLDSIRRMERITCESKHQQLLLIQTYIENKETKIKQDQLIRRLT